MQLGSGERVVRLLPGLRLAPAGLLGRCRDGVCAVCAETELVTADSRQWRGGPRTAVATGRLVPCDDVDSYGMGRETGWQRTRGVGASGRCCDGVCVIVERCGWRCWAWALRGAG